MIQSFVLNLVTKLRWLLMLVGISLMISYLCGEQTMSSKVMFTGILLNLLALIGIAVNSAEKESSDDCHAMKKRTMKSKRTKDIIMNYSS